MAFLSLLKNSLAWERQKPLKYHHHHIQNLLGCLKLYSKASQDPESRGRSVSAHPNGFSIQSIPDTKGRGSFHLSQVFLLFVPSRRGLGIWGSNAHARSKIEGKRWISAQTRPVEQSWFSTSRSRVWSENSRSGNDTKLCQRSSCVGDQEKVLLPGDGQALNRFPKEASWPQGCQNSTSACAMLPGTGWDFWGAFRVRSWTECLEEETKGSWETQDEVMITLDLEHKPGLLHWMWKEKTPCDADLGQKKPSSTTSSLLDGSVMPL